MAYPVVAVISLILASVLAFFICHNEQAVETNYVVMDEDLSAPDAA